MHTRKSIEFLLGDEAGGLARTQSPRPQPPLNSFTDRGAHKLLALARVAVLTNTHTRPRFFPRLRAVFLRSTVGNGIVDPGESKSGQVTIARCTIALPAAAAWLDSSYCADSSHAAASS